VPLQWFSMAGMLIALGSAAFFVLLVIRRLIVGPEAEGLFTLFALMFFLIGIALFGIGLLGEYVGRVYQQVRHRPRYLVEAVLEHDEKETAKRETRKRVAQALRERSQVAATPKKKREKAKPAEEVVHPSLFPDDQT